MYPFTALRSLSPFHFTSLFFTYPINPSLHYTLLFISTPHFPSLSIAFTFPHWFVLSWSYICVTWRLFPWTEICCKQISNIHNKNPLDWQTSFFLYLFHYNHNGMHWFKVVSCFTTVGYWLELRWSDVWLCVSVSLCLCARDSPTFLPNFGYHSPEDSRSLSIVPHRHLHIHCSDSLKSHRSLSISLVRLKTMYKILPKVMV